MVEIKMNTIENSRKNTAVVTGGAGFIGFHLATSLAERGYHVIIIDDLSSGKEENISALVKAGRAEFVRGSITDEGLLSKTFDNARYVFHLAAMASVPLSVAEPMACHEINATGTLKVLKAARDTGVRKVVSISSCAIYGDTDTVPIQETTLPKPQSPYAVSKLTGEQYCRVFNSLYNLATVSIRFFNIYGPGQNPDSQYSAVIPLFIKRVLAGNPPVILGDGEQTRDFIFVKDAVEACILAAETDATGEYNVGSGISTTVNELAGQIIRLSGRDVKPEYREERPGDIRYSYADISRLKKIGFTLRYPLEEGLKQVFESMKQ